MTGRAGALLALGAFFGMGCHATLAIHTDYDAGPAIESDAAPSSVDGASSDAGPIEVVPPVGIAPQQLLPDEAYAFDGEQEVMLEPGRELVYRVDTDPSEHVTFFLSFANTTADIELEVDRWDGEAPAKLGTTDGGLGLRTLAVFDSAGARTFWARIRTKELEALPATLTVTRVTFEDGIVCPGDCARLMQLPLPNDPVRDGYRMTDPYTIYRYQYGRRDLVMFVRYAGRHMASLGYSSFMVADLSQWDGQTPGTDVGALRHASHQRGKDVDLSLYGTDGVSRFRQYCEVYDRECVPGTMTGYDPLPNALFYGAFLESGRVTMSFLDRELIPYTADSAQEASDVGMLDPALVPLFRDGRHLQHWPNHHNHIHVRVSEEEAVATFRFDTGDEPFEAP